MNFLDTDIWGANGWCP